MCPSFYYPNLGLRLMRLDLTCFDSLYILYWFRSILFNKFPQVGTDLCVFKHRLTQSSSVCTCASHLIPSRLMSLLCLSGVSVWRTYLPWICHICCLSYPSNASIGHFYLTRFFDKEGGGGGGEGGGGGTWRNLATSTPTVGKRQKRECQLRRSPCR